MATCLLLPFGSCLAARQAVASEMAIFFPTVPFLLVGWLVGVATAVRLVANCYTPFTTRLHHVLTSGWLCRAVERLAASVPVGTSSQATEGHRQTTQPTQVGNSTDWTGNCITVCAFMVLYVAVARWIKVVEVKTDMLEDQSNLEDIVKYQFWKESYLVLCVARIVVKGFITALAFLTLLLAKHDIKLYLLLEDCIWQNQLERYYVRDPVCISAARSLFSRMVKYEKNCIVCKLWRWFRNSVTLRVCFFQWSSLQYVHVILISIHLNTSFSASICNDCSSVGV